MCLIIVGLYHKLHGEHRPIQMKKTVIKRRKRIVPSNLSLGPSTSYTPRSGGPPSTSSNSPSPPATQRPISPRHNPYGPLPPLWSSRRNPSQSYSPEPNDFTNYRDYNRASSPTFLSSYNEQNTLPPIRFPVGAPLPPVSPSVPSIQHVGDAIPLPKRNFDSLDHSSKRLRGIGSLLYLPRTEDADPIDGARALLSLGSRESVIRKRAELIGETEILAEKLDKLKRAVAECDEFLGKA